jgi:hypothetical protein
VRTQRRALPRGRNEKSKYHLATMRIKRVTVHCQVTSHVAIALSEELADLAKIDLFG